MWVVEKPVTMTTFSLKELTNKSRSYVFVIELYMSIVFRLAECGHDDRLLHIIKVTPPKNRSQAYFNPDSKVFKYIEGRHSIKKAPFGALNCSFSRQSLLVINHRGFYFTILSLSCRYNRKSFCINQAPDCSRCPFIPIEV
jgi:hypothetical protein